LTNFLATGGGTGGLPPFVLDTSVAGLRASVSSIILDHVAPYADALAFSYQRQLSRSTGIEVRYLRTMGRKLFVQVQTNSRPVVDAAMIVPTFFTNPTVSQLSSLPTVGSIATANGYSTSTYLHARQLPFSQVLTSDPNVGKSNYNGVSASLTRRLSRNFAATVAYTYSRTYDNSFNELYTSDLNPRRSQVGGWEIAGVFQAQSGQLVDLQSGIDSNRNGDGAGDRVLLNPSGNPNVGSGVIGLTVVGNSIVAVPLTLNSNFANVRAYVPGVCTGIDPNTGLCTGYTVNSNARYVQTGYFAAQLSNNGAGTLPRNFLRTHGYNNTDMTFIKNTRFGKEGRYNFQLAAEVYNVFNQREITIAGVGAGGRGFVEPSTAQFLDYSRGVFGGRTITMRAKFIF
jgi:hypothetical protein